MFTPLLSRLAALRSTRNARRTPGQMALADWRFIEENALAGRFISFRFEYDCATFESADDLQSELHWPGYPMRIAKRTGGEGWVCKGQSGPRFWTRERLLAWVDEMSGYRWGLGTLSGVYLYSVSEPAQDPASGAGTASPPG